MEGPLIRLYNCQTHSDQKIMFVCAVNDWHFQPLCQLCTPNHTQNHAKRLKINLESFQEINKKIINQENIVKQNYQKQMQKVNEILKKVNYEQLQIISDFKNIQNRIVNKIKTIFEQICQKIIRNSKIILEQSVSKLKQLSSNLQSQINYIGKIYDIELSLQDWKNSAKKIYFTDKLESYLEESNQIVQQFQQKIKGLDMFQKNKKQYYQDETKLFEKLGGIFVNQLKMNNLIPLNSEQPNIKQAKGSTNGGKKSMGNEKESLIKKPIIKPKRKLCKNCNQEMQYLTQNKKHLICKFCNFKQRNYIKKPI